MAKAHTRLGNATFVQYGYGVVEPNHLSAPEKGEIYAQLPADKDILLLENGQFIKYNYVAGLCNFSTDASSGPWMMVYNEVKVYRDRETDADFAMIKDNYNARVYSPIGQNSSTLKTVLDYTGEATREGSTAGYVKQIETFNYRQLMPEGTKMVPRVMKIDPGDIWTTNTIIAAPGSLAAGDFLKINPANGYLTLDVKKGSTPTTKGGDLDPTFAIIKVYTMPDLQPGVKITRVA